PCQFSFLLGSSLLSGHSLRHFQTLVSAPEYGLPEFTIVGYVNEIEITRYTSDSNQLVPVAQQRCKRNKAELTHKARIEMKRFNYTAGFHLIQWMYGCELRNDGSIRGYSQFGYNGKDFLVLDSERWVYYPLTDLAQLTAQKLNGPEEQRGERFKNYLHSCIGWLRKLIENGKGEFHRKLRPEVKVSEQKLNGITKLHCQVFGFYSRDVDVNWKRNGIDVPSDEAKHVLPNTDGTYQIRVTVEIPTVDQQSYSCHVDHISLEQPLTVKWEPWSRSNVLRILIVIVAGTIAITAVGIVVWRKGSGKKTTYAPTNTSDKDEFSTSSNV
uniref:Ig-like domain-containing protein n=1 Tax=Leptobrachium leishanense TaxID=445787 RepID=A0A8C5MQE4_9ANUR